jgi:hypothetical protein
VSGHGTGRRIAGLRTVVWLQLLLAFVLEMRGRGRQLLLTKPSENFSQGARLAGLYELLGLQNA